MVSQESIVDLVTRCVSRPQEAGWNELVSQLGPGISGAVRRAFYHYGLEADASTVEDMVQDVYCRLLENDCRVLQRCRAQTQGQVLAYLGRVAQNLVSDWLRAKYAKKRGQGRLVRDEAGVQDSKRRLVDPLLSPEEKVLLDESRRKCSRFFRRMVAGPTAGRDTRILELALLDGWSSREISHRVGLKPATIDTLICRVRRKAGREGIRMPPRYVQG